MPKAASLPIHTIHIHMYIIQIQVQIQTQVDDQPEEAVDVWLNQPGKASAKERLI